MATTTASAQTPITSTAARQPTSAPSADTSGVPATSASELPASTAAVARPTRSRGTRLAMIWASTAQ